MSHKKRYRSYLINKFFELVFACAFFLLGAEGLVTGDTWVFSKYNGYEEVSGVASYLLSSSYLAFVPSFIAFGLPSDSSLKRYLTRKIWQRSLGIACVLLFLGYGYIIAA